MVLHKNRIDFFDIHDIGIEWPNTFIFNKLDLKKLKYFKLPL